MGFISRPALAGLLLVTALLGACAPRLAPPGTVQVPEPHFTETHFVTADGLELPVRRWEPDGDATAVVLALHGFNDYSKAFEDPGQYLAEQGLLVYAYDQRGFGAAPHWGLWPGSDALTSDLRDAAAAIGRRYPDLPLFLLGESMGGAVILSALAEPAPPVAEGVILSAPAVWARSTMPGYQRGALWLAVRTIPWFPLSIRGVNIRASSNTAALRALGRDPLVIKRTRVDSVHGLVNLMDRALAAAPKLEQRSLLLYGGKDQIVPQDPTFELWRGLPPAARDQQRRALYENGFHLLLRDLDAEIVLQDIVHWIADPVAALPSGADLHAEATLTASEE